MRLNFRFAIRVGFVQPVSAIRIEKVKE